MKTDHIAVAIVSFVLLVYAIFASFEVMTGLVMLVFSLSPLLFIWMVWVVLKHGEFKGEELEEEQEFGYADKPRLGRNR